MSQVWCFDLNSIYERNLYVSKIRDIDRKRGVREAIQDFHRQVNKKKRKPIPL